MESNYAFTITIAISYFIRLVFFKLKMEWVAIVAIITVPPIIVSILGPLWVWLVIKEQPSTETIIGGAVIIITIAIHSVLKLKKT